MPLDIVSGTEVQTQSTGVKIDPSAFRRQAIAQGQLVSGAGQDVASLFSQVSNKLQDIQNTKHLAEADNAVIDFNEKQQEEVLKHPNPSEWSSIYKANFKQFQDGLMANPSYGPDVRNQIRNMLEHSKTATDINIRTAANKRNVTDLGNAIEYGINKAVNSLGEKDATAKYYAGLLEMLNSGVIDESQYKQRLLDAPMVIGKGQFDQAVVNNPIEAWKKIQERDKDGNPTWLPQFKGQNRISIENEARVKFINKQNLNQRDIPEDLSKKTSMTADDKIAYVQKKADNWDISSRYAETAIRAIKQQDNAFQTQIKDTLKGTALMFIKPGNADNEEIYKTITNEIGLIQNPLAQAELFKFTEDLYKKSQQPSKEEASAEKKLIGDNKSYVLRRLADDSRNGALFPTMILPKELPNTLGWDSVVDFFHNNNRTYYETAKFQGRMEDLESMYKDPSKMTQFTAAFGNTKPSILKNAIAEQVTQNALLINEWFDDPKNQEKAKDRTSANDFYKSINKDYMLEATKKSLGLKREVAGPVVVHSEKEIRELSSGTIFKYNDQVLRKP